MFDRDMGDYHPQQDQKPLDRVRGVLGNPDACYPVRVGYRLQERSMEECEWFRY